MGLFDKLLGKKTAVTSTSVDSILRAITDGTVKPLTECQDPVFGQLMMGNGYLIDPKSDEIVSPVNGVVQTIFPTKHAIGIVSDAGDEIIIHIGLDTVKLNGEGFTTFVNAGDKVVIGQKILEVDFATIASKVPTIEIPVVVTNIGDKNIELITTNEVTKGQDVAKVV
jgi:PTS system, glucose subfamily, IIA component